ncbi:hypothetical protein O3M35_003689 [Rhynocoris fuscipes]|uniref:Uncharacterized protein n=1 Tax=Rhynocoris fuscipes TaxID=488301 RepID=A0AAW1CNW1_9HEMI
MSRSLPPICPTCQIPISIIHIFTNCTIFSNSLSHYNLLPDIKNSSLYRTHLRISQTSFVSSKLIISSIKCNTLPFF